ncbi:uncharacterized protein UBRO2_05857 [Ustilago bromivora]|uniref:Uncharacterized protein n=1 Tax=Ustilago bromivora TaxID=307758 RepID=A0A8H8QSJ4_9BASI|nr:uncharacterized protein UBRO2_05857 [Ustilago bromivora]
MWLRTLRTLMPEYGPENFQRTQAGREALSLKLPADSRTLAAILGGGHDAETADLIDTLLRTATKSPPTSAQQASAPARQLPQMQPDLPINPEDESGWLDFDDIFAGQRRPLPNHQLTHSWNDRRAPQRGGSCKSNQTFQPLPGRVWLALLPQAQPDPPTTTQQGSGWLDLDEIFGQAAQTTPAATTRPAQADSDDDSDDDEDYDASPIAYSSLIQGDR